MLAANEIVAQIACFLTLLALLRIFLWKKVLSALDKRNEKIAGEFKHIDDVKAATELLKADYEKHLSHIDEEAYARLNEAIAEGRRIADEMRKKAESECVRILENSKESIKAEIAVAKESLKNEIVDLTIAVTEKIIQEKYTEADDKRLIGEYLEEIERQ